MTCTPLHTHLVYPCIPSQCTLVHLPSILLHTLQVHSKLKEILVVHAQKAEQRLVAQQKMVAESKRVSKAKESFMSEDAKMKRRRNQQVGVVVVVT